jgi:hypothetical protein
MASRLVHEMDIRIRLRCASNADSTTRRFAAAPAPLDVALEAMT